MNEKAREILKKEGWYEGRNIDISFWEEISSKDNFELFESAKKFLREFGGICIHKYDRVTKGPYAVSRFDKTCYFSEIISQTIKENAICVGTFDENEFSLFISESGKVYYENGFIDNNIYDAWNIILETISWDECRNIEKNWEQLGIQKEYTEAEYEYTGAKIKIIKDMSRDKERGLDLEQIAKRYGVRIPFVQKMLNEAE